MSRLPLSLAHSFRALRHRNFRLFLGGQVISLVGTWMQQVALGWLVYRLTGSAFLLGVVGFASQAPSLLVAPFAGVWADRANLHRMVIAAQALAMVQALLLAALVLAGVVTVPQIVALSLFSGAVSAVDVPARQSFLVKLVPSRDDLANAIALNSSAFNAARLVGPSVAGVLIALLGEGPVFLLNGLSYVAVIGALVALRLPPSAPRSASPAPVLRTLAEGLRHVYGFLPMRAILLLVALVSVAGVPFQVLMPVFATDVLRGDSHTLGFLASAVGTGSLAGALYMAARPSVRGLGRVITSAVALTGAALLAFAFSRALWLSMLLLLAAGFGIMLQMAASNTILQTIVDDDKRGRVMSLYSTSFLGALPLGSLAAGALANRIGAPLTVALGGIACLLGAFAFARVLPALRQDVRPVYERLGIPPAAPPDV
ncbi:MAG: MFS transporter [Vicinamibacteria bacterium]